MLHHLQLQMSTKESWRQKERKPKRVRERLEREEAFRATLEAASKSKADFGVFGFIGILFFGFLFFQKMRFKILNIEA